jgi:hypothetical protein
LLAALACGLALAACGGEADSGDEPAAPGLPPALAESLAAQSEQIAETFEGGDECSAASQADELVASVERAIAAGNVPADLRAELRETATELQNEINCPEPPPEEEPQVDCEALQEQKRALEEEKKDVKGKGRETQLEEQIKQLDEQLKACDGGGDDEEGDD